MAADLSYLAQAQAGLVRGGESGAAEAVGAHALDTRLLGQLGDGHLSAPDAERLASLAREDPALLRGGALLAPLLQPAAGSRRQGEATAVAGLGHSAGNLDRALFNVLPGQQGGLSHAQGTHAHQHHQSGIPRAGRGQHGADLISGEHGGPLDGTGTSRADAEQCAISGAAGGGHGGGLLLSLYYAPVSAKAQLRPDCLL